MLFAAMLFILALCVAVIITNDLIDHDKLNYLIDLLNNLIYFLVEILKYFYLYLKLIIIWDNFVDKVVYLLIYFWSYLFNLDPKEVIDFIRLIENLTRTR